MIAHASTTDHETNHGGTIAHGATSRRSRRETQPPAAASEERFFFCEEFLDDGRAKELLADPPRDDVPNRAPSPSNASGFFAHLGSVPLLSKSAEHQYFRKYNYLKYLSMQPPRSKRPRRSSERCSANGQPSTYLEAAEQVRNRIVEANLRLVVALAKEYGTSGESDIDELICVGNAALIRAVELFDFRRGLRFSTYAYQAISRSMITSYTRGRRRDSRVKLYGDEVPETEDHRIDTPFAEACLEEFKESARMLIDHLEARDRRIVMSRFGIGHHHDGASFSKIAEEIGISTTRTVQLFHRSMEKIRRLAVHRGLIESESAA